MVETILSLEIYVDFLRRSRAANYAVPDQILPNYETLQDFMVVVVVTCNNEEYPIKNESARVVTVISAL